LRQLKVVQRTFKTSSENVTEAAFIVFERFGETDITITVLHALKDIAEQAASQFSQLSTLHLRVANAQPTISPDMLELLTQVIAIAYQKVPALERSVEDIKVEWSLPTMSDPSRMPDPERVKQTIADSRRRRLEPEMVGLELDDVIAKLEQHNRLKRLQRLQPLLNGEYIKSQSTEPSFADIVN
jgi:thiamine biosynthesis lipoprotein ApbE